MAVPGLFISWWREQKMTLRPCDQLVQTLPFIVWCLYWRKSTECADRAWRIQTGSRTGEWRWEIKKDDITDYSLFWFESPHLFSDLNSNRFIISHNLCELEGLGWVLLAWDLSCDCSQRVVGAETDGNRAGAAWAMAGHSHVTLAVLLPGICCHGLVWVSVHIAVSEQLGSLYGDLGGLRPVP